MIFPSSLGMRAVTMAMLALLCEIRAQEVLENVGPSFVKEPPGLVEFMNTLETRIDCVASGQPTPSVTWISVDGSPVTDIPEIRKTLTNGTLILYPFRSEQYRPDIHSAMYRCLAKNAVGTITSIDVQIRAVLQKSYEVQVYDTYAMEGNIAVIKCHVPTVVKDYVEVVAWIKNDNLLIRSKEIEGSLDKYTIMPTGALHIREVNSADAGTKYKCKTLHRLNGETQVSSSAGQLFVTESRGKVVPRIVDSESAVSVKQGNVAVLSCVAQGNPTPDLKWFVKTGSGQLEKVPQTPRYIQTLSSLVIREAQLSDEAVYSCAASSELGNDHLEITLTITNAMFVQIYPKVNLVKFGGMAVFSCRITGEKATTFAWLHNGSPIAHETEKLTIHNVQMSNQGMYQCMVKNAHGVYQASSELRLTEIVPQWVEKFKEIAVYPGSPVSVQCIAIGVPLPEISWTNDYQPIKNNSQILVTSTSDEEGRAISRLVINSAVVEDGGLYSCKASNNGGETRHYARINVYGRIHVKSVPALVAVSGNDVKLNCPMYGYPWISIKWEKSGHRLPSEIRHSMMANGSLLIENVHRSGDSGIYNCIVQGQDYGEVKGIINLQVMVPPKLVPFEFQDELLREGMRARLQCVVSDGDLPLNVTWLKDGKPMPSQKGVLVRTLDEFSSILTISSIQPGHNGNYTCMASNKAATVTHTAELSVNVRPKIVPFLPRDVHYEGSPARLVCGLLEGDAPIQFSWLKDGTHILNDKAISIHHIDGLSSILSIGSLSSNHAGNYTCIVSNAAGTATYSFNLKVNVPPKIVQFSFQDEHISEGVLARVSCVVSRGDLPLKLTWEKDGIALASGSQGVQIRSFDDHSSILNIAKVSPSNNGKYTCIASNEAGSARHSAQLIVKVPPSWKIEPDDKTIVNGENILLHCQADGYPTPTITWIYGKTLNLEKEQREILQNTNNVHIFQNGTLQIQEATIENAGYYFCKALNGIGTGVSKVVFVQVYAPPQFEHKMHTLSGVKGKTQHIQCSSKGDRPMKIVWHKDGRILINASNRYQLSTTETETHTTSELTIKNVGRQNNGTYNCVATNNHGSDKATIVFLVIEHPDPPINVKVSKQGSQDITLKWEPSYNGNSPIKAYVVKYFEKEAPKTTTGTVSISGQQTSATITGLKPASDYFFQVSAENKEGRGKDSETVNGTTTEEAPTGPPLNVQVESTDHETIKVSWKPPNENLWNGRLQGYYVGFKEMDSMESYTFKTLLTADPTADDLSVQIGLKKQHAKYSVVVQAYNNKGKGPLSDPVMVMTSEGAPKESPAEVRCTTLTSQSIHVTWTAPSMDSVNGILKGYKVTYRPSSDWFDEVIEQSNTSYSTVTTLRGLEKFTNYSIQVLAFTKSGEGPNSESVFCKTHDDVPDSAMDVKAVAASSDAVMVSWKSPENRNGVLKSYTVYWTKNNEKKETASHTVTALHSFFEVNSLNKGQQYEFWVTASTLVGEGKPSRSVFQTPTGPTVIAKIVNFDDKVVTPWKTDVHLMCHAVGVPEPSRKWSVRGKMIENNNRMKVLSDGSLSIKEVNEDDTGDYICQVHNELGDDRITYTVIVLAPPAPPTLEVSSTSSKDIDVQWKVSSNKLAKVKGFILYTKQDEGDWQEIPLNVDARNYKLKKLECGTRYELYMSAYNKIGIGSPSEILLVSTNGSVPIPPTKSDMIEETPNSISLYLNTWKSNGCPILYFAVEYAPKQTKEWTFVSNNVKPEQRRLVIPGLMTATWYTLRMTAHNSAGSTVAEYTFATLSASGATISPDVMMADGEIKGLIAYLNMYVVVPVCITVVTLLIILAVACIYVKSKKREDIQNLGQRYSTASNDLPKDFGGDTYNFMQRSTLSRRTNPSIDEGIEEDPTPYATCHRSSHPPPLPPPNMSLMSQAPPMSPQRFNGNFFQVHHMNPQFLPPPPRNFLLGQGNEETTFIFPSVPPEDPTPNVPSSPTYVNDLTRDTK